jgi:nucleotide-binding universal stress UspA family protein
MTIKTILVAPIFEAQVDAPAPEHSVVAFATQLASRHGAHLNICLGVGRLTLPSAAFVAEVQGLLNQTNEDRRAGAKVFGDDALRQAQSAGVTASLEFAYGDYSQVSEKVTGFARASDISIAQPRDQFFGLAETVIEELMFSSGGPLILLPVGWKGNVDFPRIVIAWDGSAKAARAIGDAMPFVDAASEIEIVTIAGDSNSRKQIAGVDIASRIVRHARNVHLTELPCTSGDIAQTLRDHVTMTRADLLVMGAYGHARFRQFIIGGVTRSVIADPPVPVLMSY